MRVFNVNDDDAEAGKMTRTITKDQAGRLLFQQKPHNQDIGDLHLDLDRHLLNKPSLRSKRIATNMMRTMYQLVITLKRDCQGWLRSEARAYHRAITWLAGGTLHPLQNASRYQMHPTIRTVRCCMYSRTDITLLQNFKYVQKSSHQT